jgi:hypothetical protein
MPKERNVASAVEGGSRSRTSAWTQSYRPKATSFCVTDVLLLPLLEKPNEKSFVGSIRPLQIFFSFICID